MHPFLYSDNLEIVKLNKEKELLEAKYRIVKTVTEEDIKRDEHYAGHATYTIAPPYPDEPKQAFELLVNYYAKLWFIRNKISFLQKNKTWQIQQIESELKGIQDFITSIHIHGVDEFNRGKQEREDYINLSNGFYENNKINTTGSLDKVYGKYFLYRDFLIDKIEELYNSCTFSKLNPNEQLDTLLRFFNDVRRSKNNRIQILKVQELLEREGINIPIHLLYAIVNQLVKDEYLEKIELLSFEIPFYVITFKGKWFCQQGGYVIDFQSKNLEKDSALYNTKWMRRWSLIAATSTFCLVLIEVIKLLVKSFPPLFFINLWMGIFLILACGISLGIIAIVVKELSAKDKGD